MSAEVAGFPPEPVLRGQIGLGLATVILGFCGFVLWLLMADLSGAVVASGQVVIESDVKKIQHQTGGIVGDINVRNGQRVAAGDVLTRLDETIPRTNLA